MTFESGSKDYFRVHPQSGKVTLTEELDREVYLACVNHFYICLEPDSCLLSQAQDAIEVFVSISDGLNKASIVDLKVLSNRHVSF